METLIIGIAGGTGSGKTTLARRLDGMFGVDVSLLTYDNYYKRHDELTYEERCLLNYDHPDAFDAVLLEQHLLALKRGESIESPVYDFAAHNRSEKTLTVPAAPVIILEGIMIFAEERIRRNLDMKIFVDTEADVRILRRITRDVSDRGRDLGSVIAQYLTTVKPMHEQFVEPSRRYADLIVPEGGENRVALEILTDTVRAHLARHNR
ncbi:MAG: uridine kinase [Oscillospiraceae bacterium]|nr:uridine kinase [Oscillospiraceae bacterium]